MATNMDKALYQAPKGLSQEDNSPLEIEIVDPEAVKIHAGGTEIEIIPDSGEDFSANLVDFIDTGEACFGEIFNAKILDVFFRVKSGFFFDLDFDP